MARLMTSLIAAGLIVTGAVGDHLLAGPQAATPSASASQPLTAEAVNATSQAPNTAAQAIDGATEYAFSVASPSVVFVNNVGVGSGSGVIYNSTGDIVTNAHVVAGAQSLTVTLKSGKTYTAHLVGTDVSDDLAVIHISASGLPAAHFAAAGSFQVAQAVLAIGNPLDLQQSVSEGLISALDRTVSESNNAYLPDAIQTSAPINPGNSGGALVTLTGTVVGIPTLEASDPQNNNGGAAQGIGFAIPSTRVTLIASQLIQYGHVVHSGRAYLGVSTSDNNGSQLNPYGFYNSAPSVAGALITSVGPGTPAAQAGLQQGDVITAADGNAITSSDDLLTALANAKPGQSMTFTVNRNGQTVTIKVHLGELPVASS